MKKIVKLITLATLVLILIACSNSNQNTQEKSYDKDFIKSLAIGLDNRWKFVKESEKREVSMQDYIKAASVELTEVEKYQDLKFKDSELKELAITYINLIKRELKIAETFGSESFDYDYDDYHKNRKETLVKINQKMTIDTKDKETLKTLLAEGNEVNVNRKNQELLQNFVNTFVFEGNGDSFGYQYETIVSNTTGLDINYLNLELKLYNQDNTVVETTYIPINNWVNGESRKLDFWTSEDFSSIEYILYDFEVSKSK